MNCKFVCFLLFRFNDQILSNSECYAGQVNAINNNQYEEARFSHCWLHSWKRLLMNFTLYWEEWGDLQWGDLQWASVSFRTFQTSHIASDANFNWCHRSRTPAANKFLTSPITIRAECPTAVMIDFSKQPIDSSLFASRKCLRKFAFWFRLIMKNSWHLKFELNAVGDLLGVDLDSTRISPISIIYHSCSKYVNFIVHLAFLQLY